MIVKMGFTSETMNALLLLGLVASLGTSVLVRRYREARTVSYLGVPAALVFVLVCLADWTLLKALPLVGLSFSRAAGLPLVASILVRLAFLAALLGAILLTRKRHGDRATLTRRSKSRWRASTAGLGTLAALFLVTNVAFSLVQLDAYVVEPLMVQTTELALASSDLDPTAPAVRVVHLTDTHIERFSYREQSTVRRVNALKPDIVVLTGDYLNTSYQDDPESIADFRRFVEQIEAPYGIYAVRGSVEYLPERMARLVEGTRVVWLEQETITVNIRGQLVTLVGVACSHQQALDEARLARTMQGVPQDAFTLLLYHSPDLITKAAEQGIDLFLAGHTHGGQIRLPFYGAVVTFSRYGKRYTSGLFKEGETAMFVSRGLGFEGGGLPRARFLCRPEIARFDLMGKGE